MLMFKQSVSSTKFLFGIEVGVSAHAPVKIVIKVRIMISSIVIQ